jgi:hypothetical protein
MSEIALFLGAKKRDIAWAFLWALGRGIMFVAASILLVLSLLSCIGDYLCFIVVISTGCALVTWGLIEHKGPG